MVGKLVLLGSLYLAQGLPYGFFTLALPVLLRERGLSLPLIGLANLLALPWALKFAWAPIVDRVQSPRGRRRAVIVPLQLASCVTLAALAFAGSEDAMWPLMIAILVINVLAATQDIATDALAVEILSPAERGLGNGLQVGAYRAGMIIGGGAMLHVFADAGWTAAFVGMAATLLAASIPIIVSRAEVSSEAWTASSEVRTEPSAARTTSSEPPTSLAAVRESLTRPGMWPWIAVLLTYKTGEWFATGMLRTFLVDHKLTKDDLATMLGFVGFTAAFIGALTGGVLTARLGRRRALLLFGAAQTVAIGSFAIAALAPSMAMFYAVTVLEHLASAMATTALFTSMMDFSRKTSAGTDYTLQASLVVIATGLAAALSGLSAHGLGYAGHFAAAAGISCLALVIAGRIEWPRNAHHDTMDTGDATAGSARNEL